jgi:hypothetical protein
MRLLDSSRDRWHQQNFIAFLEGIRLSAQKADVFFVDINVQESANLTLVVAQVGLEFRKLLVKD